MSQINKGPVNKEYTITKEYVYHNALSTPPSYIYGLHGTYGNVPENEVIHYYNWQQDPYKSQSWLSKFPKLEGLVKKLSNIKLGLGNWFGNSLG